MRGLGRCLGRAGCVERDASLEHGRGAGRVLRRFSNSCEVSRGVQRGVFLGKTPLKGCGSALYQLENRCNPSVRECIGDISEDQGMEGQLRDGVWRVVGGGSFPPIEQTTLDGWGTACSRSAHLFTVLTGPPAEEIGRLGESDHRGAALTPRW
jgi:hypothetical protein